MGAFTAPLVFADPNVRVDCADRSRRIRPQMEANAWLEFHASMSMIAYGAFALACIAGLMYLVQERQLKRHQLHSVFHHLPPLTIFSRRSRACFGLASCLYTAGLVSGFFTGQPLPVVKMVCAIGIWLFYGAILQGRHFLRLAPKQVAVLCVVAFSAAVSMLWGITFVSQTAAALIAMNLFCVGISHHTANVETRERYVARPRTSSATLREIAAARRRLCSRPATASKFMALPSAGRERRDRACSARGRARGSATTRRILPLRRRRHARSICFASRAGSTRWWSARRKCSGRPSRLMRRRANSGGAGPLLHRLFQRAFRVAKQVRTHTDITRGAVSVGSVAVELAGKIFGDLSSVKCSCSARARRASERRALLPRAA